MIVVTGASRGLGNAICHRLAAKGERIVGLARSIDGLAFDAVACDVSEFASVKSAARCVKGFGEEVTALINAAGIASMNLAVMTDTATVERLIQTNLMGTIYCCQQFAPLMMRKKTGPSLTSLPLRLPWHSKANRFMRPPKQALKPSPAALHVKWLTLMCV